LYSSAQFLAIEDKIRVFDGVGMSKTRVGIDLHLTKNAEKIISWKEEDGTYIFTDLLYY